MAILQPLGEGPPLFLLAGADMYRALAHRLAPDRPVVGLFSQNEIDLLPEECQLLGLEWFHLPVEDDEAPSEPFAAAWEAHRERLKELVMTGKTIAIHCKGGSGRTGLFAARLMIECGIPVQEAVSQVQALRPRAIQNPAHVGYINQFSDTL